MNSNGATPDNKDWTWVLDRPCPECGAWIGALSIVDIADANRVNVRGWTSVLERDEGWLRTRPEPGVWSPLEYACHVRDVFRLFAERLDLMLSEENPSFANWDPNRTQEEERYNLATPHVVREELAASGEAIAKKFDEITSEQLARTGHRSDGADFTVETFARYEIHDPVHHLWDVTGETSTLGR